MAFAGLFSLLVFVGVAPGLVYADTVAPNEITATTTWTAQNSPYVVSSSLVIDAGASLIIQPGVTVKSSGEITVLGTLLAGDLSGSTGSGFNPSNQNVIFTSSDDKTRSAWGMAVSGGQLTMEGVIFRHSSNGVYLGSASTTLLNMQISDSAGILASAGTLNIKGSDFENDTAVLSAYNQSVVSVSSTTVNHLLNQKYDSAVAVYNSSSAALADVSFSDITTSALAVYNQSRLDCRHCLIQESTTSPGTDSLMAYSGSALNLENSSVLSSGSDAALALYDTTGISSSTAIISNSIIDGGAGNGVAVYGSAFLTMSGSVIKNFSGDGIVSYNGSGLNITSSDIESNNNGLDIWNAVSGFISSSTIQKNTGFGITSRTDVAFNARGNWWGDSTGPDNSTTNPGGKGNQVSDDVNFSPWVSQAIVIQPVIPPFFSPVQPKSSCCSSIAFLPGIEGSRLYELNTIVPDRISAERRIAARCVK